jgi:RNA polymerase sigma-70 factor (sigma-E family)
MIVEVVEFFDESLNLSGCEGVCMGEMRDPLLRAAPTEAADSESDRVGLESVFRDDGPQLFRLAMFLTSDRAEAQDVVADAFESTIGAARRRPIDDLSAYLRPAVVNRSRSRHRKRSNERAAVSMSTGRRDPHYAPVVDGRLSRDLMDALQQLPHRQRTVVVLRNYLDMSEKEAADAMGVSVGTVKAHGSRGLSRLRELLEEQS